MLRSHHNTVILKHFSLTKKGVFNGTYHTSTKRAVPVSDQRVCHHQGDGVWVGPSNSLYCDSDMSQGHLVITHTDLQKKKWFQFVLLICIPLEMLLQRKTAFKSAAVAK